MAKELFFCTQETIWSYEMEKANGAFQVELRIVEDQPNTRHGVKTNYYTLKPIEGGPNEGIMIFNKGFLQFEIPVRVE